MKIKKIGMLISLFWLIIALILILTFFIGIYKTNKQYNSFAKSHVILLY